MSETFLKVTLPILSFVLALMSFALGALFVYVRTKKKDAQDTGEQKGVLLSDIGYIKAGIDDLKSGYNEIRHTIGDHEVRITRNEENIKALKEGMHNA